MCDILVSLFQLGAIFNQNHILIYFALQAIRTMQQAGATVVCWHDEFSLTALRLEAIDLEIFINRLRFVLGNYRGS